MTILFGLIQALVIIYLFTTKPRFKEHKSIVFIISVIAVILIESLFLKSGLMSRHPHFLNISAPFLFLLGPLNLFYVKSQLKQKVTVNRRILHLLIFGFYFLYSFNFFLQSASFKYNIYVSSFHPNTALVDATMGIPIDPWEIQGWVVMEMISLHLFIYGCLCLYKVYVGHKRQASISKDKLKWLLYIAVILIIVSLVLFLSHGGIINGKVFFNSPFPEFSPDLLGTIIMYLLTIFIVLNPDFFKLNAKKYSRSSLSKEYKTQKLKLIKSVLENDKIFLSSENMDSFQTHFASLLRSRVKSAALTLIKEALKEKL